MFSDKTYNILKKLVQIVLPAISSLYFGLAAIWDLPAAEQVIGTIALVTTFLGVCLGISTKRYDESNTGYDGTMTVHTPEVGPTVYSLELDADPEELSGKKDIKFKVAPK